MCQLVKNNELFLQTVKNKFLVSDIATSLSNHVSDECFGGFALSKNNGRVFLYAYGIGKWCTADLITSTIDIIFNELNVDRFYFQIRKENVRAHSLAKRVFPKVYSITELSTIYCFDKDSKEWFDKYAFQKNRLEKLKTFNIKYPCI